MGATDTMGIRVLDQERMQEIWHTQQRHIACIQDSPGVQLYRKVGVMSHSALVLLCTGHNIPGVIPPAPESLCARYKCKCIALLGVLSGKAGAVE